MSTPLHPSPHDIVGRSTKGETKMTTNSRLRMAGAAAAFTALTALGVLAVNVMGAAVSALAR
jgi:hypothetical protein